MPAPNLEGTYQLVSRDLPDGTHQVRPQLNGMLTITKEYRNFSVVWKDEKGKYYSECYVARYKMSEKEYSETQEYLIINDQIQNKGISYDLAAPTASSPVTIEGTKVRFALPQPFEKALNIEVVFEGPKMTASSKGLFVDHWEKVS